MKVAVVGSGVSGLGAAWLLSEHSDHDVHVYEADTRLGGHANTVEFPTLKRTGSIAVDTGFIVLNPVTYPNFLKFLRLKNVPVVPTEMTFSVSRDGGLFEWAGDNLSTVFCQPSRLLDPQMWRLIYDVVRFNACASSVMLNTSRGRDMSIGQYLKDNNYSHSFRDNYLIPMTAAVWSTSPDKCALDFPARTLQARRQIQFLHNHHLLQVTGKPSWLTIHGGSKVYIRKIISSLKKDHLHLATPVVSLNALSSGKLELKTSNGEVDTFDHVVLACHSDTAVQILNAGNITADEERILTKFKWNRNEVVLHSDTKLMPRSRLAWSCWNYLSSSAADKFGNYIANIDRVSLTYLMNDLQHISEKDFGPVLVTLNPPFEPQEDTVIGRWPYEHPVLDSDAVAAQAEMHNIQNSRGISFAGAYLRYGFHEDGFTSGIRAAVEHLGAKSPFEIKDPDRQFTRSIFSYLFNFLECSGIRVVGGFFLSCLLYLLRIPVGFFIDLSHICN